MIDCIFLVILFIFKLRYPSGKSVIEILRGKYGHSYVKLYIKIEDLHYKCHKLKLDIEFLELCLCHNLYPKFLNFKVYCKQFRNTSEYKSWQKKLLLREIKLQNRKLKSTEDIYNTDYTKFKETLSFLDFTFCYFKIVKRTRHNINRVRIIHNKKLESIGIQKINYNDKCIFNQSNRILTCRETEVLSLGLDFCIPYFKPNYLSHHLQFHKLLQQVDKFSNDNLIFNNTIDNVKNRINNACNSLFKNAHRFKNNVRSLIFKKTDIDLLNNLKSDPSIVITKPDKGRGIVILDRITFESKVDNILSDTNTFKPIHGDLFSLTIKLEDRFNRILRTIKSNIGDNLYRNLYASGTRPGILYCLPKIHKVNTPLRPIISSINTAGYKIAKFIGPFLSNLTVNDYNLKDSATFFSPIRYDLG